MMMMRTTNADLDRPRFPAAIAPGARVGLSWPPASGMKGEVLTVAADRSVALVRLGDGSEIESLPGDLYLLADPRRLERTGHHGDDE